MRNLTIFDLKQHLLKEQQLPDNVKKIKIHKTCQRNVYNQNKKRSAAKAFLPDEKKTNTKYYDHQCKCLTGKQMYVLW